jgi:hypothetical protein
VAAILRRNFGHSDFGIYATVQSGGTIAIGDTMTPSPS